MPQKHGNAPSVRAERLAISRCEKGSTLQVIFLASGRIKGLLTHHVKDQGVRCHGETCSHCRAKADRSWKGYTPILVFRKAEKDWLPSVLEVTEALELDLRGLQERGQEWAISRAIPTGKKRPPIVGRWVRSLSAERVPATFDCTPAVRTVYHDHDLVLETLSHLPARILVEPFRLDEGQSGDNKPAESPDVQAKRRAAIDHLLGRNGQATFGAMPEGGAS